MPVIRKTLRELQDAWQKLVLSPDSSQKLLDLRTFYYNEAVPVLRDTEHGKLLNETNERALADMWRYTTDLEKRLAESS